MWLHPLALPHEGQEGNLSKWWVVPSEEVTQPSAFPYISLHPSSLIFNFQVSFQFNFAVLVFSPLVGHDLEDREP